MDSSLEYVKNELKALVLKYPAATYLVAVSGGLDSMLLLKLLHDLKLPVQAMHINYRLRGFDSDQDAAFVEDFCFRLQIPLHLYRITDDERTALKQSNLQAKARSLRYTYFEQISKQINQSLICTAHHADDQIETFWLQLSRGAGMKGLAGMPIKNGLHFRPFLAFKKELLYHVAQTIQLEWREDQSNQSKAYRRNIWRNQFLPELSAEIPDILQATQQLQKAFQAEIAAQQKALERSMRSFKNKLSISLKELSLLSVYQFIELLKYMEIPMHIIHRIPELFHADKGKKLTWKTAAQPANSLLIFQGNLWLISGEKITDCPYFLQIETSDKVPHEFESAILYLDSTQVKGSFHLKLLKKEDLIYPIGMRGKKAAFDILKENKIPALLRPNYWGLFDDEKLLQIINFKTDRRALATNTAKEILKVSIHKKT